MVELHVAWGGLGGQRQIVSLEPRDRTGSSVPPGKRKEKRRAQRKARKTARQKGKS